MSIGGNVMSYKLEYVPKPKVNVELYHGKGITEYKKAVEIGAYILAKYPDALVILTKCIKGE